MLGGGYLYGQKASQDSLLPGNKHFSHEIGVNTTPLLAQLIGTVPFHRYEFSYKRNHTNFAFRSSLMYSRSNSNHTFATDSSLHANFFESQLILAKAGYERHIHITNRILMFYGVDLHVGFESTFSNFEEFDSDILAADSADFVMNSYSTDQVVAGMSPVLGLKVPVSRRLSFTAQTGFQFLFGTGTTVHTRRIGQFGQNPEVRVDEPRYTASFSFDASPILNNLSINVHF